MQTAGDHQMQDEPEIAVHANGDALADAPEFAHDAALGVGEWGLGGSKEKGAGDSNALDWLTNDAWFECGEVGGDVGEFGHVVQIAGGVCVFASGVFTGEKFGGVQRRRADLKAAATKGWKRGGVYSREYGYGGWGWRAVSGWERSDAANLFRSRDHNPSE